MYPKIKKYLFYSGWFMRFSFATALFLVVSFPLRFSKKYKNLWLISERPDEARDNGYWLYRWIIENHPETNVFYVLSKNSVDYGKMPSKNRIIEPHSPKHYIYYILSSYSISTHMHGACPGKSFCVPFLPFMRRKKTVFLQHGVTKNKINLRGSMDAIIAVSEEEKKLLELANPHYKGKIYIEGFCRYDTLDDVSKSERPRKILVMPTFRKNLRDIGRLNDADEVFKNTEYYKRWAAFLNDRHLVEILEKNNLELVFFPHMEMQKLAKNLKSSSSRVRIGKEKEFDVQNLLKQSSILVTDYSSVLFDFAYMEKPVIFYQFDQKEFFAHHYKSSGEEYPFGYITTNKDDLVKKLSDIISKRYKMPEKYREDAKNFYTFRDKANCERNYELIRSLR